MIELLLALLLHQQPIPHCAPIPGLVNEYTCTVSDPDIRCQAEGTVDDEYDCDVAKYGPTTREDGETILQWCDRQAILAAAVDAIPDGGTNCGGTE